MGTGPSKEPDISTSQPATNTDSCLACHTTHTCQCQAFDRGARIAGMKMKRTKTSLFIAKLTWNVASRAARLPCLAAESPGTLLRFTFGGIEVVKTTPSPRLRKRHGKSNVSSKTKNGPICCCSILSSMSSTMILFGKSKIYFYGVREDQSHLKPYRGKGDRQQNTSPSPIFPTIRIICISWCRVGQSRMEHTGLLSPFFQCI